MPRTTALVPAPVARLNRGLLGLRVSLYAVVAYGLVEAGAPAWVLLAVAAVVAIPALRHRSLIHRRVHLGVGTSIVLEFLLWSSYGPLDGLDFVPIVSVSVAALLLSRRAAAWAWFGALGSQAVSAVAAASGGVPMLANGVPTSFRREAVALVLIAMVGPAFRAIAGVLHDLQEELAERVKTETRLTEVVAEKDRFLEGAAHTLRTPLTGVLGLAEVVESGGLDRAEHDEMVATIIAEGRRLARAVDNVIVGSRLPTGRVELQAQPIDLGSVACSAAAGRAIVRGQATASGDRGRMVTILGNLVDNAEMHGSGDISMSVWEGDGRAWFEVSDQGDGVAPKKRDVIFERYETHGEIDTQPVSMGLGLPVSRELIRAMGGDLECLDPGNRFRGWLPLVRNRVSNAV